MKTNFRAACFSAWITIAMLFSSVSPAATPDVFRSWFTPTVVPTNFAGNVRFEAEITGGPSSVVFNYSGTNRLMYDDGSHGDLTAGDNIWTCLFTTDEIFSKNTASRVFRPFIGTCNPTNAGAFNTVAEVWTPQIGLAPITSATSTNQETDYVVNYLATKAQLTNFNAQFWANRFYATHADKYDFLNFLHIAGVRDNRMHVRVKSSVQGVGVAPFTNTASFGSAGRLQGYTMFPISTFYDCGGPAFNHETGHQWINYLSGTAFSNGIPHWPKGNIAINVMGFSIPGVSAGGNYPYTFTTNGSGGYIVGPGIATNISTFNPMELYLMGLAAPAEVPTYFVQTNQNVNVTNGQTLTASEITLVTINDVIAAQGSRVPASTNSQRTFRCATIILSEQLLDQYAMSFYDYFARRAESRQPLPYTEGLVNGTGNPFYVATGGRAVMFSKIADDTPTLALSKAPNQQFRISFNGKMGISYQPQRSFNLTTWSNDGVAISITVTNPPVDPATNFLRSPLQGTNQTFYRLKLLY